MNREQDLTTTTVNTEQAAAWNGPEGETWAAQSARRAGGDLVDDLVHAAALLAGDRVLDIGCGTGDLTRRCAGVAVAGHALGLDLSELMIDRARAETAAAGIDNAEFEVGDVQIHPFPPRQFDVALSHFGIMFFDDPVAAFTNVARALRRSGRLAFVCPGPMESCDWYGVPLAALYGHRPTAEDAPSVMFSLAHPPRVREILTDAGFEDISVERLDAALWFGQDADGAAAALVGSGPVRSFLERHPAVSPTAAQAALSDAVEPYAGVDGVRIPGWHWLVRASSRDEET